MRVDLTDELIREAASLADRHRLRAYDAVHLSSALSVRRRIDADFLFASDDRLLSAAASDEGLELAPR